MKVNRNTKKSKIRKNKTHKKKVGGLGLDTILKNPSTKKILDNVSSGINPMDLLGSNNENSNDEKVTKNIEENIKRKTEEIMCSKLKEIINDSKSRLTNIISEKFEETLALPEFTSRIENVVTSKITDVLANEGGPIYTKLSDVIQKSFEKVVHESILKSLEKEKENLIKQ